MFSSDKVEKLRTFLYRTVHKSEPKRIMIEEDRKPNKKIKTSESDLARNN